MSGRFTFAEWFRNSVPRMPAPLRRVAPRVRRSLMPIENFYRQSVVPWVPRWRGWSPERTLTVFLGFGLFMFLLVWFTPRSVKSYLFVRAGMLVRPLKLWDDWPADAKGRADAELTREGQTGAVGGVLSILPAFSSSDGRYDLILHFHGNTNLVEESFATGKLNAVVVNQNLGIGSGPYEDKYAHNPGALRDTVERVDEAMARRGLKNAKAKRIALTAWSAGYGAIVRILEHAANIDKVDTVILLDGIHASFLPDGSLDPLRIEPWARFARRAIFGDRLFVITHSEIKPLEYPGTHATTDSLLQVLELTRTEGGVQPEFPPLTSTHGVPKSKLVPLLPLSEVHQGNFHVYGYDGEAVVDHIAHLVMMGSTAVPHLAKRWAPPPPEESARSLRRGALRATRGDVTPSPESRRKWWTTASTRLGCAHVHRDVRADEEAARPAGQVARRRRPRSRRRRSSTRTCSSGCGWRPTSSRSRARCRPRATPPSSRRRGSAGKEAPAHPDTEQTLDELRARVAHGDRVPRRLHRQGLRGRGDAHRHPAALGGQGHDRRRLLPASTRCRTSSSTSRTRTRSSATTASSVGKRDYLGQLSLRVALTGSGFTTEARDTEARTEKNFLNSSPCISPCLRASVVKIDPIRIRLCRVGDDRLAAEQDVDLAGGVGLGDVAGRGAEHDGLSGPAGRRSTSRRLRCSAAASATCPTISSVPPPGVYWTLIFSKSGSPMVGRGHHELAGERLADDLQRGGELRAGVGVGDHEGLLGPAGGGDGVEVVETHLVADADHEGGDGGHRLARPSGRWRRCWGCRWVSSPWECRRWPAPRWSCGWGWPRAQAVA